MLLNNFRPISRLVTKTTLIDKPRYPVIDAHNHLGEAFGRGWINRPLAEILSALDEAGVVGYVDLDGGWGEDTLDLHLNRLSPAAERFRVFCGVDWGKWPELGDDFPGLRCAAFAGAKRTRRVRTKNLETIRAGCP
jgi:hypothetical protein